MTALFEERFPLDGASWPQPWRLLGGTRVAEVQNGTGRLVPAVSFYSLARWAVSSGARDVEVTFTLRFEDVGTQGVGFYVRQNGGYLRQSSTFGEGYAVFVEGFRGSRVGVWREVAGQEQEISFFTGFAQPLASGVTYAVRFRVTQVSSGTTRLQARVWNALQPEPTAFQVDATDTTPSLQNVVGGLAVDSWSTATAGQLTLGTRVDDIVVVPIP